MKAISRAKWSHHPMTNCVESIFVEKKLSDDPEDINFVPTIILIVKARD